jgi:hypothetical protein
MMFISNAIWNILCVSTTALVVVLLVEDWHQQGTSSSSSTVLRNSSSRLFCLAVEQQQTTTTAVNRFTASSSSSPPCNVVTVSGFPASSSNNNNDEDLCIQDICGGCSAYAADLNGDYVLITDVTNQMVDPLDNSKGEMPVYVKQQVESDGSTPGAGSSLFFLYYEPFGAYSLTGSGSAESWAIGPAIGSACTDDWGYCRCGHSPPACCSVGPSCASWFAKQVLFQESGGTACQDATSYDDRAIRSTFTTTELTVGTWNINRQTSNFYAGRCFPRTVTTEVSDVVVTCKTKDDSSSSSSAWSYPLSSAAVTKISSNDLNLEQRVCSLGAPVSLDDCRLDRCQGCRRDYSPSGCDVTVESCQCADDNSGGGGGNTFSPTASPSTSCQQLKDDPSFFFRKKKRTCRWIGKRAHRIKKFCVKKIKFGQDTDSTVARKPVSTFCPMACGVCSN